MKVEQQCQACHGTGRYLYSNSAMGMGIGGQTMTEGPCPGTRRRPDWSDCPVVLAERDRERPKPCPECELLGYRTCDCMEVSDER